MVRVTIKTSIAKIDLGELGQEMVKKTGRKLRGNFGDIRPLISSAIDNVVIENKNKFIPNQQEAAELGVGEGGDIAFEKTETAWEALLSERLASVERVTTFKARKVGGTRSRVLGNITIDIDKEAFYNAPRSIIDTPDSDELNEIPWMRWFIEGEVIGGAKFSDRQPVPETSRTGRGIMIKGGFWAFKPRSIALIEQLLNKIRIRVGRDFRNKGATILRK